MSENGEFVQNYPLGDVKFRFSKKNLPFSFEKEGQNTKIWLKNLECDVILWLTPSLPLGHLVTLSVTYLPPPRVSRNTYLNGPFDNCGFNFFKNVNPANNERNLCLEYCTHFPVFFISKRVKL